MTVDVYLMRWLTEKRSLLEKSTAEAYTVYITRHLCPWFAGKELTTLKPMDIQKYVTEKLSGGRLDGKSGGMSPVSVRKHLHILRQALSDAVLYGEMQTNPAQYVRLPRTPQFLGRDTCFLTLEESKQLLNLFEEPFRLLVKLTLYYGLRRSEVLGLKWSAINFVKDTIAIRHTVVKNVTIVCKDRMKTASSLRTYQLFPDVRADLIVWDQTRRTFQTASDYLFAWYDGRLFRPDYVTRKFERTARKNGFAGIRFHDLRHSTASILFERGWNVKDVQQWLGHSDIETTLNIYVHYTRSRKILLGNDFAGLLTDTPVDRGMGNPADDDGEED